MKTLHKDEKYTEATVEILEQIMNDAVERLPTDMYMHSTSAVCVDTCIIYSSKMRGLLEISLLVRICVEQSCGNFHSCPSTPVGQ